MRRKKKKKRPAIMALVDAIAGIMFLITPCAKR